jgi:hypothetical protein
MHKRILVRACAAAAAALTVSSAASAEPWKAPPGGHTAEEYRRNATRWEMAFVGLSVIDTLQTAECINRGRCDEGNPIYGRHPSVGKLVAIKAAGVAAHYGIFRYLNARNPINSRSWAIGAAVVTGGAVALNARFMF